MNPRTRVLVSVLGFAVSAAILALAIWLDPDPSGVGTHTQLGLQPCALMSVFGFPCPMCGMTTTFSLMADLRFGDALLNQPLGVVLFLATTMIAIISALEILSPSARWVAITAHMNHHYSRYIVVFSILFFGSWFYKMITFNNLSA